MTTFVKVILLAFVAVLLVHLWPIAVVPFVVIGLAIAALGAITAGGVAVVLTVGMALVGAVLAVIVSVTAALSPVWIPVVLVLGIISLAKRRSAVSI